MMSKRNGDWIQLASGRQFWPLDPRHHEIEIRDIAHALARQCRFTGHVRYFYSVAEHSVHVSYVCDPGDALHALLHDGSEAYLVDLPRPLKRLPEFRVYLEIEARLQAMIFECFGLSPEMPRSVKDADDAQLDTEACALMAPLHPDFKLTGKRGGIHPELWTPEQAESRFLKRFHELTEGVTR
jgi:uncharacterized protein